jgi:hypothetical protein
MDTTASEEEIHVLHVAALEHLGAILHHLTPKCICQLNEVNVDNIRCDTSVNGVTVHGQNTQQYMTKNHLIQLINGGTTSGIL